MTEFAFHHRESFNGAVARWADEAWIERMMDVTRAAGILWGHRQTAAGADEGAIRALAAEMEVDASELLTRATPADGTTVPGHGRRRFQGIYLPVTLLEGRLRRHAPASLSLPDGVFHRALWDLRLLPVCVETGQILIDRCQSPECGKDLGWQHTMGIDRCEHCMADLKNSRSSFVPADLLEAIRPVAALMQHATRHAALRALTPELAGDDGQLAVDLLLRLVPVVDPVLRHDRRRLHRADPLRLCRAVAHAWRLMVEWPRGFHDLALARLNEREARHNDGNDNQTMDFLNTKAGTTTSSAVAKVVANLRDDMDLHGRRAPQIAAFAAPIKEAARIVALGTAEVAALRRVNALGGRVVIDRGVLKPMLDRAELTEVAKGIGGRLGFDAAKSRLGISHHGVEQLADLSLIDVLPHPFFEARYGIRQSTASSIAGFERRLLARAGVDPADPILPLATAMMVVGGRLKPWGPVFGAMLAGRIAFQVVSVAGPLSTRIGLHAADVPLLRDLAFAPRTSAPAGYATMMSKMDAAETLNINEARTTEVFAHVPTPRGSRVKSLAVEAVLDLARTHISSGELAVRRGVASRTAYNDAVRAGVPKLGSAGFCRKAAEHEFLR